MIETVLAMAVSFAGGLILLAIGINMWMDSKKIEDKLNKAITAELVVLLLALGGFMIVGFFWGLYYLVKTL